MKLLRRRNVGAATRALAIATLALAWAVQGGLTVAFAQPDIVGVRMGVDKERTRFVLDVTEAVDTKIFSLAEPDRLVIDLPSSKWTLPSIASTEGVGLVKGYRFGQFDAATSRIVLDLSGPVLVKDSFPLPPGSGYAHRYVIDLEANPAASPDPIANGTSAIDLALAAADIPMPLPKPKRLTLTIAIDPGHGGADPGAESVSGLYEKDVVLDISKELRNELRRLGYNVVMTRSTDVYPSLRSRVSIARAAKADLFVSIHADSNPSKKVLGASVYTLSDKASDKEAAELVALENRSDVIAGIDMTSEPDDVSSILIELSMRQTMNESARFAKLLLPNLGAELPLVKNTHRFGSLIVLKAPDIPSVLVELGHLSNAEDEKRLTDPVSQKRVAKAITRSIDRYFFPEERADLR